jgi:hypothetical protein
MLTEQPRVQWAPGVLRIVMLVASDLTGSGANPCSISGARSLLVSFSSARSGLATIADRQFSPGVTAPTSGPVRRSGLLRGASPSTWRFQGRFHASPSGRMPLRTAFLLASIGCFRSAHSRPCSQNRALLPHLPAHLEPADSGAPLAASAVREACSEGLTTRVFRRYCGHRCHLDQVELSHSLSGG